MRKLLFLTITFSQLDNYSLSQQRILSWVLSIIAITLSTIQALQLVVYSWYIVFNWLQQKIEVVKYLQPLSK